VIKGNAHRYPISAQCEILGIARATYYLYRDGFPEDRRAAADEELAVEVERVHRENRGVYGARKIKSVLDGEGVVASRRRIGRAMKKRGLTSAYHKKAHRPRKAQANGSAAGNVVARGFSGRRPLDVLVGDLTYVRVGARWAYTCLLLDLANREIVGHGAARRRDAGLVKATFATVDANLFDVDVFHSDRGAEFAGKEIDELLGLFGIRRSLSAKGDPWDNAVAEATFRLYKAEFASREAFATIDELKAKLADYVHWFNNVRVHSTLGYLTPVEFKRRGLTILSK
jgi:transposase InsO family protein